MKPQPKPPLTQFNLPLREPAPLALPAGKHQQLVQALIQLLLSAAASEGANHESQIDR